MVSHIVTMICTLFLAYRLEVKLKLETTSPGLPPSGEVEMGDDIPRPLSSLTSSSAMSGVANPNSAVAYNSGELERQRQLAQYEIQQQEIIHNQQI